HVRSLPQVRPDRADDVRLFVRDSGEPIGDLAEVLDGTPQLVHRLRIERGLHAIGGGGDVGGDAARLGRELTDGGKGRAGQFRAARRLRLGQRLAHVRVGRRRVPRDERRRPLAEQGGGRGDDGGRGRRRHAGI